MSIEISVLSDARLSSIAEWQKAIDAERFPLLLPRGDELDGSGGSLIVELRDRATSIEYRFEDFQRLKDTHRNVDFGRDWKRVLAIPWIHGFDGLTAAWMVATAYARTTGGVVFDPQESKVFDPAEALKIIQDIYRTRPEGEAALMNLRQQGSAKL
jgi:hypothetical protein